MTATSIDLRDELKELYTATKHPAIVEVPELHYLVIDGRGDPNTSPECSDAIAALYAVSYTAKFTLKRGPDEIDVKVMPLEGLWWAPDMTSFEIGEKSAWRWSMMIVQPDPVTDEVIAAAIENVARDKPSPAVGHLRFETFREGRAAQVLHVGPYGEEGPAIQGLHAYIRENGLTPVGRHHEIYLSDPRRAAPEKLRTIIRQPIAGA